MKKVIIIALLITVLATLFLCGSGVCFADESPTNYYYVDKGNELTVRSSASREAPIVMQIPATYAFEYVDTQDEFITIKYNSYEYGYITKSDFSSYCKPVTSKWGDNPYYYPISLTSSNITTEQVTLYNKDTKAPDEPLSKSMVTIDNVYGYYHSGNEYYFLVRVTIKILSISNSDYAYIKASDTQYASFNKDTIEDSVGYANETKVIEQTPSGDDDSNPTIANPGSSDGNSVPATNNFERYLLIAVIAVLCVVIIILIFAPNKSRRKS